jgi:DNA mismatch endonuclease (patch repair protein)
VALRRELWQRGLRYRLHVLALPGKPDIVFPKHRVVVFCDGDFWHGRHLQARLERLASGHNSAYWRAKILRNVERDKEHTRQLRREGWCVLRFWETEIIRSPGHICDQIQVTLRGAERLGSGN